MHSSQVLESIEVLLGKRKQGAEAGWRKILKENQWLIRATREWKPLPAPNWAWAGNWLDLDHGRRLAGHRVNIDVQHARRSRRDSKQELSGTCNMGLI
jgi:hypothetical protein